MSTVTGNLALPADSPTSSGARAAVVVRDITFSDAPAATPVAQSDLTVDVAPGAHIPFSVEVPQGALDRVATNKLALNLEVHIDLDGDGTFSAGDLVSLKAQPIGPETPGTPLEVPLERV
jgi:inner membrane protein involved in colicin E2 resistance